MNNREKEILITKIHRYITQKRLKDIDLKYITHLFREEKDQFTQTREKIHLHISAFSDDTLLKVKEYISKCEAIWRKNDEENEEDTLTTAEPSVKKGISVDTSLFFEQAAAERETNMQPPSSTERPVTVIQEARPIENVAPFLKVGLDNKKRPLSYYKGIYQRIMRKSRSIKNHKSIPHKKKKRTSDIIGQTQEPIAPKTSGEKVNSALRNETDVVEPEEDLDEFSEEEEEEAEIFGDSSSIVADDEDDEVEYDNVDISSDAIDESSSEHAVVAVEDEIFDKTDFYDLGERYN